MSMKYYDNSHNVYEPYQSYVRTFLNPYSPMSRFVITIHYPKIPNYNDEEDNKVVIPEISINDFLAIMPQFKEELDGYSNIYFMYEFYLELAKETIDYHIIGKPQIYKYIVMLYTAHNLEMNIRAFKDEANKVSLNNEVSDKDYYVNDMAKLIEKGDANGFNLSYYGNKFLEYYSKYISWNIRGGLSRRRLSKYDKGK